MSRRQRKRSVRGDYEPSRIIDTEKETAEIKKTKKEVEKNPSKKKEILSEHKKKIGDLEKEKSTRRHRIDANRLEAEDKGEPFTKHQKYLSEDNVFKFPNTTRRRLTGTNFLDEITDTETKIKKTRKKTKRILKETEKQSKKSKGD